LQAIEINIIPKKEIEVSPVVLELSEQLMAFMKGHTPFTNPQYSLQNVLTDILKVLQAIEINIIPKS